MKAPRTRTFLLALAWAAAGLAPVLGLPNHRYAYYLTHAWVPLTFLAVVGVETFARRLTGNNRITVAAMTVWILAAVGTNIAAYESMTKAGDVVPMARASPLMMQLPDILPDLPDNAVLIFEGVTTGGLANADAVRVLYDKDTVTAYSSDRVRCSKGEVAATDPETGRERVLGPPLLWIRAGEGTLVHVAEQGAWGCSPVLR